MELKLEGNQYHLHYRITEQSYTGYSRGDHYAGDGEYKVWYGAGEVTVRDMKDNGTCRAVCKVTYSGQNERGHPRPVNDEQFRKCVEVDGLLPHRKADYADWLAVRLITQFLTHQGDGAPSVRLESPKQEELIQHGFILDEVGQAPLSLSTAP